MKNSILIVTYILFFSIVTFGQNRSQIISTVNKLLSENEFKLAENLLETNYIDNSSDLEYVWLYAYTAHKNKHEKLAKHLYKKAISIVPDNMDLKLEYARALYESGNLREIQPLINVLKKSAIDQSEVLLLEAKTNYWKGMFGKANESLKEFNSIYPESNLTNELAKSIDDTRSPNLRMYVSYFTDNQPLQAVSEQIEFGQYRSWLLYPTLKVKNFNFSSSSQVVAVSVSNLFQFVGIGLSSKLEGGVYYNQNINKTNFIGAVSLTKSFFKKINLEVGLNRNPYIATRVSTTYDLLQNNAYATIESGIIKPIFLHVGYNFQFFDDQNNIQTFGIWGLSKPIFKTLFKLQLGYGFSYSDSKTILYVPSKPIVANTTDGYSIVEGEYSPYFTPDDLLINSAIIVMGIKVAKKIEITVKGNYGFYAQAKIPQLSSISEQLNNSNITLASYKSKFNPFDLEMSINYNLNNKFTISAKSSYFDTYYYNSLNTVVSLNYRF